MDNADRVITNLDSNPEGELEEIIHEYSPDKHITKILMKDVHLIECAIAIDNRIISLDKKARFHFATHILNYYNPLKMILWVVPLIELNESCVLWLENGAPDEAERRLVC
ncbi:MAG: hypothetical protein P9X24_01770 [Candidatus Hatepunaea meridiana]|nr:hypothetical protein [Candidatus Hatepunaea meridiana]